MEYFYITQDKRYSNVPYVSNFYETYYPNLFCPQQCYKIPDKNVVYAGTEKRLNYTDMLSGPVLMVSEQMKRVLEAYGDIVFKMFFILNISSNQGEIYYAPILEKTDCISLEKGIDGTRLVLKEAEIVSRSILKPVKNEWRGSLVVDMMVAESLLRRQMKGIHFQRLEVK